MPTARRVADGSADAARQARGAVCPVPLGAACAVSPRRGGGGAGTGRATPRIRSTTLANRCRASSSRRAALAPRGEAETVTTARKARLDPADHHAPADPAEAVLAELTDALAQLRRGRFDVRLPRREGAAGALADQFNDMAAVAQRHNRDLLRIGRSVGREGRMGDRLDEESYDGSWGDGARAVNALIDDLAAPTAEIARVIEAVAEGDLSQHMALEIEGRTAARRVPAHRPHREHDGRPAVLVRRRGHARGARGRHRRAARAARPTCAASRAPGGRSPTR